MADEPDNKAAPIFVTATSRFPMSAAQTVVFEAEPAIKSLLRPSAPQAPSENAWSSCLRLLQVTAYDKVLFSVQCDIGQIPEFGNELILETYIRRFTGRLLMTEVVPVEAAHHGSRFLAYREPTLRPLSGVEAHRSKCSAHLRARPAGVHGIAQDSRPTPRHCKGKRDDVELAFSICSGGIPTPFEPIDVAQRSCAVKILRTADIDQPIGSPH